MKNIEYLHVIRLGRFIKIRVKANAFLYHMVRNIVGCLVYVARAPEVLIGWEKFWKQKADRRPLRLSIQQDFI